MLLSSSAVRLRTSRPPGPIPRAPSHPPPRARVVPSRRARVVAAPGGCSPSLLRDGRARVGRSRSPTPPPPSRPLPPLASQTGASRWCTRTSPRTSAPWRRSSSPWAAAAAAALGVAAVYCSVCPAPIRAASLAASPHHRSRARRRAPRVVVARAEDDEDDASADGSDEENPDNPSAPNPSPSSPTGNTAGARDKKARRIRGGGASLVVSDPHASGRHDPRGAPPATLPPVPLRLRRRRRPRGLRERRRGLALARVRRARRRARPERHGEDANPTRRRRRRLRAGRAGVRLQNHPRDVRAGPKRRAGGAGRGRRRGATRDERGFERVFERAPRLDFAARASTPVRPRAGR